MNIASSVEFSSLGQIPVPPGMEPFRDALLSRLNLFKQDLIGQLRKNGGTESFPAVIKDESGNDISVTVNGGLIEET